MILLPFFFPLICGSEPPPEIDTISLLSGNAATGGGGVLLITGKYFYNTTVTVVVSSTNNSNSSNASNYLNVTNASTTTTTAGNVSLSNYTVFPTVNLGVFGCLVFDSNATDGYIKCIIPKGEGKDLPVVVQSRGFTSNPGLFSYLPPSLISYNIRSGPTTGGQLVIMNGTNLGLYPFVHFVSRVSQKAIASVNFSALVYDQVSGYINFALPEGAGANLTLRVCADTQCANFSESFSFFPPTLSRSIARLDRSAESCFSKFALALSGRDTMLVNKSVGGNCFPTVGDFEIVLSGTNLGPPSLPLIVKLGPYSCDVVSHTHTQIVCMVPPGTGESLAVTVIVEGQSTDSISSVKFSFDPPVISSIYPNMPNGFGQRIVLSGYNFGTTRSVAEVFIDKEQCLNATWVSDATLECNAVAGSVGSKSLSILVANRLSPFVWSSREQLIIYTCMKGSYGMNGESCINCETEEVGANCPGGENLVDLVTAKPGYYRFNISNVSDASIGCHPVRRADRAACPVFVACEPKASCLGANACSKGYTGARCSSCESGYYRVNGACRVCPTQTWALIALFLVLICLLCFILHFMSINFLSWPIGFLCADWGQIMSLYSRLRIPWPTNVSTVILGSSVTTLNLDLVAPECTLPEVTLIGKWIAIEALPFFIIIVLLLIFFLKEAVWPCLIGNRCTPSLADLSVRLRPYWATFVYAFRLLFLYLCRNTLDIFNCRPTTPSTDGYLYLDGDLTVRCYEEGSPQMILLPYACAGIFIYLFVLPMIAFRELRKNRDVILYDMLAVARGSSLITQTSKGLESDRQFRDCFHPLYQHFIPHAWYWEFVIGFRKFAIIGVSILFSSNASFQQGLVLLILLISSWLHLRVRPYFSHERASRLLEVYDPEIHMGVAAEISQLNEDERNGLTSFSKGEIGSAAVMIQSIKLRKAVLRVHTLAIVDDTHVFAVRKILQTFPFLSFSLDPNIIESGLLGSLSILLILGLMLGSIDDTNSTSDSSDRFSTSFQKWQLGWAIFAMNMFQLFYVALVLVTDILILLDSQKFFSFVFFFFGSTAKTDFFEDTVLSRKNQRHRREHMEAMDKQRFFVNNIVPKTFEQVNEEATISASAPKIQFHDLTLRHGDSQNGDGKRHKRERAMPSQVSGVSRISNYAPSPPLQVMTIREEADGQEVNLSDVALSASDHQSEVSSESAVIVESVHVETDATMPKKRKSRWD